MALLSHEEWEMRSFTAALSGEKAPRRGKLQARDYKSIGKFPVIDQGQNDVTGWTDDELLVIDNNLPYIVFGDHTRAFKYVDRPFALGADGTQLLKPSDEYCPRFFYYACLQLDLPSRGYNRHFTFLKEKSLPLPPKPEQQKIAAVLRKMQSAIATQDRLIAATRDLKQSAMQQLFTRGLRGEPLKDTAIGQMPESWKATPVRELREFLQYGTSAKCGYAKNGRPVIRIPNIVDGRVDTSDIKWADLTVKEVARYELVSGDVIFIRTNGVIDRVGTCSVFRDELPGALFASYLIRVRPNGRLHSEFYHYYSMTAQGRAQLSGRASPAADGKFNINTQTIESVLVPLPSDLDEQREIAAALAIIDRKLAHHQQKRAALNDLFQTTLHQLMTAQIRVADLDIDTSEVTDQDRRHPHTLNRNHANLDPAMEAPL